MQQTTINPFHLNSAQLRNKRLIYPAVLMLLAGLLLGATAGAAQAPSPHGAVFPYELKVMTWNIRGGEYIRRGVSVQCTPNQTPNYLHNIAEEIERHAGLDLIALQEVYRDQANRLARYLARTHGFQPEPYFVETRSCGRGDVGNDFGIAIISRYPLLDKQSVALDPCIFIFCPKERRMLARAIIRVGGIGLHVYNTHLNPGRLQQFEVRALNRKVNDDRNHWDQVFLPILMGDFNARPASPTYNSIRAENFLDAWRLANGEADGFTFETFRPSARIDYVFVGGGGDFHADDMQVTSSQTLFDVFDLTNPNERHDFNKVPDHRPIVGRLSFNFLIF